MARRKGSVNKTSAILTYASENPGAGPSAISEALTKQGIRVSPQYVSTIRSKHGVAKRRGSRGRTKTGKGGRGTAAEVAYSSLVEAKRFVQSLGGMAEAKKVLDAYEELQ